jgi:dTDP-4-dehydrorhamnose 3,5-epimerase
MQVTDTAIPDVKLVRPVRHVDHRGFFTETYNARALAAAGIDVVMLQDNHSLSHARGTVRGLHLQLPPQAQAKLVRVVRGAILDVAVDLRRGERTFGQHVAVVLDAASGAQLFIPPGFAHGLCTLESETEVFYKVSAPYAPALERGVRWNDPSLGIEWPDCADEQLMSPRDGALPLLADQTDLSGLADAA